MTKDEAISTAIATLEAIKQFGIGKWMFDKEEIEAFDMAIEALEKEEPPMVGIKPGAPDLGDYVIAHGVLSLIRRDGDGTMDVELQNVKEIMKV